LASISSLRPLPETPARRFDQDDAEQPPTDALKRVTRVDSTWATSDACGDGKDYGIHAWRERDRVAVLRETGTADDQVIVGCQQRRQRSRNAVTGKQVRVSDGARPDETQSVYVAGS
jgi:hypothetical protein